MKAMKNVACRSAPKISRLIDAACTNFSRNKALRLPGQCDNRLWYSQEVRSRLLQDGSIASWMR